MTPKTPRVRTTCVAAAAAVCGATGAASADTFRVDSDLSEPVDFSQLTVLVDPELHRPETVLLTWGVDSGGTDAGANTQAVELIFNGAPDVFFVLGLSQSDHVVLSFNDPTSVIGDTFGTLFPGFDEATVASQIRTGDEGLATFIEAVGNHNAVGAPLGSIASAIELGGGTSIGTFSVSLVPAPGALLAGVVAGTFGVRRRRRALG